MGAHLIFCMRRRSISSLEARVSSRPMSPMTLRSVVCTSFSTACDRSKVCAGAPEGPGQRRRAVLRRAEGTRGWGVGGGPDLVCDANGVLQAVDEHGVDVQSNVVASDDRLVVEVHNVLPEVDARDGLLDDLEAQAPVGQDVGLCPARPGRRR